MHILQIFFFRVDSPLVTQHPHTAGLFQACQKGGCFFFKSFFSFFDCYFLNCRGSSLCVICGSPACVAFAASAPCLAYAAYPLTRASAALAACVGFWDFLGSGSCGFCFLFYLGG